jgi:hypothetical protein
MQKDVVTLYEISQNALSRGLRYFFQDPFCQLRVELYIYAINFTFPTHL